MHDYCLFKVILSISFPAMARGGWYTFLPCAVSVAQQLVWTPADPGVPPRSTTQVGQWQHSTAASNFAAGAVTPLFFSPTLLHTGTAAHRKFPRAACFGPFPLATFSWGCWRSSKKWKSAPAHQQIRSHLRRDFFMRRSATRFWCHYNKQIF
jgi:hypothetical protein